MNKKLSKALAESDFLEVHKILLKGIMSGKGVDVKNERLMPSDRGWNISSFNIIHNSEELYIQSDPSKPGMVTFTVSDSKIYASIAFSVELMECSRLKYDWGSELLEIFYRKREMLNL